jgi:hypothetical protein
MEASGQLHVKKQPAGSHWIGSWVSPRVYLDAVEKRKISCPFQKLKLNLNTVSALNYVATVITLIIPSVIR